MRVDHIAWRTPDRDGAVKFFEQLGYKEVDVFNPFEGEEGPNAEIRCSVMVPAEKYLPDEQDIPYHLLTLVNNVMFHMAPEIFISEGPSGSIVGDWVIHRNVLGHGGIHHIAYQTFQIKKTKRALEEAGIEFVGDIIDCPDDNLKQVFSKPIRHLGDIVIELIQRGDKGSAIISTASHTPAKSRIYSGQKSTKERTS